MTEFRGWVRPRRRFRPFAWLAMRMRGFRVTARGTAVLLIGMLIGYLIGREAAYLDIKAARALIQRLQSESQKFKAQVAELTTKLSTAETKLSTAQATLEAIMPTQNTYNLSPNQSLIVADGHLTIGLIGAPMNGGITININGQSKLAVAGDVTEISPDPSTTCQVGVQSFDMFKAILTASCSNPKPSGEDAGKTSQDTGKTPDTAPRAGDEGRNAAEDSGPKPDGAAKN